MKIWLRCVALCISLSACVSHVSYTELAQEYFNLGNAYFEIEDYDASYLYYSKALELSKNLPAGVTFNLVRLYIEREEYIEALQVVDMLLEAEEENSLYRETRAFILYKTDELEQAYAEYMRILQENPARFRVAYNLALMAMEKGDS